MLKENIRQYAKLQTIQLVQLLLGNAVLQRGLRSCSLVRGWAEFLVRKGVE